MKRLLLLIAVCFLSHRSVAQVYIQGEPLTHTYSIVAFDAETGEMGVAVQSHWFSVGTIVSWGEAGVGVVATQSLVNPSFGPRGLALLKNGLSPQQALDALIANDPGRGYRQVAILDKSGRVAVYTGDQCIAEAGHVKGQHFSAQANMMRNQEVWGAMEKGFTEATGPLAGRLLAAIEAAEAAGGDIRGKQSAALLVVRPEATGNPWEDRVVDLRIEDHPEPVKELGRLLKVHQAYQHMNAGDLAIEAGDTEKALAEYSAAEALFPDNLEMKFWHAVSLINMGEPEKARPMLQAIFREDDSWRQLLPKLTRNGMLNADEATIQSLTQ